MSSRFELFDLPGLLLLQGLREACGLGAKAERDRCFILIPSNLERTSWGGQRTDAVLMLLGGYVPLRYGLLSKRRRGADNGGSKHMMVADVCISRSPYYEPLATFSLSSLSLKATSVDASCFPSYMNPAWFNYSPWKNTLAQVRVIEYI